MDAITSNTQDTQREIELKQAIRTILTYIGEDPDREGLQNTPDRICRMYHEISEAMMPAGNHASRHSEILHTAKRWSSTAVNTIPCANTTSCPSTENITLPTYQVPTEGYWVSRR